MRAQVNFDHQNKLFALLGFKVLSLKRTAQYKYLGTWTFSTMCKTIKEKLESCVKQANTYRNNCKYVSRYGPDRVDVIECTWLNVAIPSILSGCEMIPFTETKIAELERIQSDVAKYALGVVDSTPIICA